MHNDIDIILPPIGQHDLYDLCLHDWNISPQDSSALQKYYLLHWSMKYFKSKGTTIKHQGITYQVWAYKEVDFTAPQIALSFRKMYFLQTGIVLVRSINLLNKE